MDYNQILIDSVEKGDFDGVQSALKHGADVNSRGENDNTALMLATRNKDTEMAKLLIDANALLDTQNKNGSTALTWAAEHGRTEIAQLLIDAGADLNIKDNNGCTALDLSLEKGHYDIATLIKSHMEKRIERQEYVFDLNI